MARAARMDGADGLKCFWHITCPLLVQRHFFTGILSLVNAFKVFREAYMIAGNYPHDSIYMLGIYSITGFEAGYAENDGGCGDACFHFGADPDRKPEDRGETEDEHVRKEKRQSGSA